MTTSQHAIFPAPQQTQPEEQHYEFIPQGTAHVDLSAQSINTNSAYRLADEVSNSPSLETLIIKVAQLPISELKGKNGQTEIDLSDMRLTPQDAIVVAACIRNNNSLEKITVWNNLLGNEGVAALTEVTHDKQELSICGFGKGQQTADLSGQKLGDVSANLIILELPCNSTLTCLNLLNNNMRVIKAQHIVKTVRGTGVKSLCGLEEGQTTVDLSRRGLSPCDGVFLAYDLEHQASITSLSLANNELAGRSFPDQPEDTVGIEAICTSIQDRGVLKRLDLSSNALGPASCQVVATTLIPTPSMSALEVWGNPLGGDGVNALIEAAEGKQLSLCGFTAGQSEADLSNIHLGPDGLKLLASDLSREFVASSLEHLTVNSTKMDSVEMSELQSCSPSQLEITFKDDESDEMKEARRAKIAVQQVVTEITAGKVSNNKILVLKFSYVKTSTIPWLKNWHQFTYVCTKSYDGIVSDYCIFLSWSLSYHSFLLRVNCSLSQSVPRLFRISNRSHHIARELKHEIV